MIKLSHTGKYVNSTSTAWIRLELLPVLTVGESHRIHANKSIRRGFVPASYWFLSTGAVQAYAVALAASISRIVIWKCIVLPALGSLKSMYTEVLLGSVSLGTMWSTLTGFRL